MTTAATIGAPKLRADELLVDCAAARAIDNDARRKDAEVQKKLILAGLTGGPYARITGRDRDGRPYRPMQKSTIGRFADVWGVEPAALLAGGTGLAIPRGGATPTDTVTDSEEEQKEEDEKGWRKWLRRLWATARRHSVIALVLLTGIAGLAIFANWLAYDYPARTISAYYDALNRNADTPSHHDTRAAWQLLSPKFQEKYNGDWSKFDSGFETTYLHDIPIKIDVIEHRWNPVEFIHAVFLDGTKYDVVFSVKDYFHRSDCFDVKGKTREDCKFINQNFLEKLNNGSIDDPLNRPNPAITVRRWYWKIFTLKRNSIWSLGWLIRDISWVEWGVISEQEGTK